MRREALAPLVVIAGLTLAGLSASTWHDGPAGSASTAPQHSPGAKTWSGPGGTAASKARQPRLTPRPQPGIAAGHRRPIPIRTGTPRRLDLPSLGVSADVSAIGTDGSLVLIPPSDYTTVGWWAQGAEPGDGSGTTILAGHTVHTGGGALDNLGDMKVGATVTLRRARQSLVYDVTSVTTYRKGALAARAARVFDQTGPERLAIVTCGDWNGEIYLSNVVAIASNPRPVGTPRR